MIYLIGGAPRVGKSIAAKAIAHATSTAPFSTDDVCGQISTAMSEEERALKFPLPGFSGDPTENTLSPEDRVKLQIVSAQSLEPEIDRMIADAVSNQETLILEGVHLLPDHVRSLVEQYGLKNISPVFVGSEDVGRVVEGIQKNTNPNNWLKESDPAVIRQVAEFAAAFSAWIRDEAERNSLIYMERSDDFEGDMKRVIGFYANPELKKSPR